MMVFLALQLACVHSPQVAPPVSQPLSLQELREVSLPSVALLYGHNAEGKLNFGSGILLPEENLLLTNWHVVESQKETWVMLYDPARETFTALDGGVSRVIRESGGPAYRGHVIKSDIINDLALVELEASGLDWPKVTIRETPAIPGEEVWALGHPASNVWSFTRGVVSAVHRGSVQHDASINGGNSGGPLMDMQGRIIGVNTLKQLKAQGRVVDGIGYARPMELAAPLYDEDASLVLDTSTPEAALRSFWLAVELGREEVLTVLAWESSWEFWLGIHGRILEQWVNEVLPDVFDEILEKYNKELDAAAKKQILGLMGKGMLESLDSPQQKEMILAASKVSAKQLIQGRVDNEAITQEVQEQFSDRPEYAEMLEATVVSEQGEAQQEFEKEYEATVEDIPDVWEISCGIRYDPDDPTALSRLLKLGLSVEAVRIVDDGSAAWVSTQGFQSDGTPFRCPVFFRKLGESWRMESLPSAKDIESLPDDFSRPSKNLEDEIDLYVESLSHLLMELYTVQSRESLDQAFKAESEKEKSEK